jgi:serine phosphatase RsbU (regulator of sigma subunit)/anti-sigma regulatory factor (Ser/Thr protein kinase)
MAGQLSNLHPAERLDRLQRITDAALARLSVDELLDELLTRLAEILDVDTLAVLLLDETRNELVARAAKGLEEEVEQGVRIPVGKGFAGTIADRREPLILDHVDHTNVMNPILRSKGIRSLLGVPLLAHGDVLGVMHVGSLTARVFDDDDIELLQLVADRVALALQVRMAEQARLITETFQRTFLPQTMPHAPGLRIVTRYLPAATAAGIGGDWYDAFTLPSGNHVLAMGDVAGHGIAAASTMGQVRNALRAFALMGSGPADLATQLDRFMRSFTDGVMLTLLVGTIPQDLGAFRYVSAGHVPPLVVDESGPHFASIDESDPPLGLKRTHDFSERTLTLRPGSTVVLYTDGLIERRGESLDEGFERLRAAASRQDIDKEPNRAMLSVVSEVLGDNPEDDAAIMLINRFKGVADELAFSVSADAQSLAPVRRSVARWLEAGNVAGEAVRDVVTAVNEAATNVVEHAYGPAGGVMSIVATRRNGSVEFHVRDAGVWRETPKSGRGRGLLLMRGLMDDVEIDEGARGTTVMMRRSIT